MEVWKNMQNSLRKTIKKVAAIGTGVAMLGMTLTGALAADLSNYPSGLGLKNDVSTVLVVGASAGDAVSDNAAATDIAAGLPAGIKTSGGTVVTGESKEDIPIGIGIANQSGIGFDKVLEDDDIAILQDKKINFKSSDYDIREVVLLGPGSPSIETSLTSSDDDYKTDVVMETGARNTIKYIYVFDDSINIGNATTSNPLTLKFLGKTLKIVSTDSDTKFTAYVGAEYFLSSGESVVVSGKKITLKNVGSTGSVVLDVDGVTETISSGNTETVNGIEITNDEAFYTSAGVDQTAASLVIGKDASDTFSDGDYYPGGDETCDNNDPKDVDCWLWTAAGLRTTGTTTIQESNVTSQVAGTYVGVKNDFVINDDTDNPQKAGDCLDLPNNYVSICMDSLTVDDDDYLDLEISYQSSADFSQAGGGFASQTAEPAIYIKTNSDDTLELVDGDYALMDNISGNVKAKEVYLSINSTSTKDIVAVDVFYKNKDDNKIKYVGAANATLSTGAPRFFRIKYKDSKDTNIEFDFGSVAAGSGNLSNLTNTTPINITMDVIGDSTTELDTGQDDLVISFGRRASGEFISLGATASTEEAQELIWNGTNIGTKDEDHRTKYGIIIKNPKGSSSSDKVLFKVPSDQVQANIVIKGAAVTGTETTTTGAAIMTDSQVTDLTAQNVIAVGGPCANSATATLMAADKTWPACATGFSAGNAIIELKSNGAKWAVIAAGYSADDTRRAGVVLKNADTKLGSSVAGKSSVTVSGTTLEVSGISVA